MLENNKEMPERENRFLTAVTCTLFCMCIVLSSLIVLFTVGFTNLTNEGQALVYPIVNTARETLVLFLWILVLFELGKDWRRGFLSAVLCFLYSAVELPGGNLHLVEIALLASLSNLSSKKMSCGSWLLSHIIYMVFLSVLFQQGLVKDVLMINHKTFLPVESGHSFGMGHPNSIGVMILSSTLACWMMVKPRKWWITFAVFETMAALTLWICLSRTSSILMAAFPFLILFVKRVLSFSERRSRSVKAFFASIPILMVLITIALGQYGKGNYGNFWVRFQDLNAIQSYGITLWGRAALTGQWYYLDNEYLWILLYCGAVPFAMSLLLLTFIQTYIVRTKQRELLAVSTLYLFFGLMERTGVYSAIYFVPMVAFSGNNLEHYSFKMPERFIMLREKMRIGKRWCLFTAAFLVLTLIFYWVVAEDWSRTAVVTDSVNPAGAIVPDDQSLVIDQSFPAPAKKIRSFEVMPTKILPDCNGSVTIQIIGEDGVIWQTKVDSEEFRPDEMNTIHIEPLIERTEGEELHLLIDASSSGLSFQQGKLASVGKYEIQMQKTGELTVNGLSTDDTLVLSIQGENELTAYKWIVPGAIVIYLFCIGEFLLWKRQKRTGKMNKTGLLIEIIRRYKYLLKTLVLRDFRIKYQSSVLGVLWSFLNPLLTMFVYLFVFSMIFRSNIEYFPVYLLSGIVMFNYFSESTSLGLLSIVGNRALITKVYMPKYIYPLAKVLSSAVNLVISFIPLFIVILVTGMPIHKSILLLPLVLVFQIMFCTGMSLILSALNVFFRDIQFLWGILITIWNFLTPIFYPESIIPRAFAQIYHLNPLYQIIYFMRSIIIGGVSPAPITFLYCFLVCGIPLLAGIVFFHRKQDQFVLYL